ncbi:hypothetical protein [Streptomyces showdoensis]|uniref:Secreted protein n=1 Tax=Streptomyces showdoensis TaxID=68268 RepID=A0A2P2GTW7_STREW|nr:hypothetical protein [Streptomyces showdoensis]KKZ74947.1 hypothetical protein VO63_05785 [Streptomyces showdoensis]
MSNLRGPQRALAASFLLAAGTALGLSGSAHAAPLPLPAPVGGLTDVLGAPQHDKAQHDKATPVSGDAQNAVVGGNASEQSIGS